MSLRRRYLPAKWTQWHRLFANANSASEALCFDKGGLYFGYLKDYAKGLTLQP